MCTLYSELLRFDSESAWWSVWHENEAKAYPILRIDGRRLIVRYGGNYASTPDKLSGLVSCGTRAGFTDGIDLTPG